MDRRVWSLALAASSALWLGAGPASANEGGGHCTYGSCAPSSVIINEAVTEQSAVATAGILSDRIGEATNGGGSGGQARLNGAGLAAGSQPLTSGGWFNFAGTSLRDTHAGQQFNGPIWTFVGGLDHWFTEHFLGGLGGGYERIDVRTGFNSGTLTGNGFAIAPYAAYRIDPWWTLDGTFGHTWISYDEAHQGVTGSFNGDRWFGSTNLSAKSKVGSWDLMTSLGYFYVTENQSAYQESNANLVNHARVYDGQARLKLKLSNMYPTSWGSLSPFVSARLEDDIAKSNGAVINSLGQTAEDSRFHVTFGAGVHANVGERTTWSFEGTSTEFRKDLHSYGANATVRTRF